MENKNNQKKPLTKEKESTNEKEIKAKKKYFGKFFVVLIFCLIVFEYYIYMYQVMWKRLTNNNLTLIASFIIIYHILLLLMLWSLITTMNTHPGEIPLYWGFYIGDEDYKRKRYCLICNAFKPERSHHCSVCNICVLNMDHHCPWVDNCIGFYNRKYFMQLLFYLCLLCIFMDFTAGYDVYIIINDIINLKFKYDAHFRAAGVLIAYGINLTLSFLITMFFKFHVELVLNNSTTIESLDKEHKEEYAKFNLSKLENWRQVFGENVLFWFLPFVVEHGRPCGDGLTWPHNLKESFCEDNSNNIQPNVEMKNYNSNYASNNYHSTNPFNKV